MKSSIHILSIFLLTFPILSEEIPVKKVKGKVDSVILYSDRALVRRVEIVSLSGGQGKIRFTELPAKIIPGSIRASGKGLNISGIQVKNLPDDEDKYNEHPSKKKLEELRNKIRSESDLLSNFQSQLNLLNSFAKLTTQQTDRDAGQNTFSVENWGKALLFLEGRRTYYQTKIHETELRITALNRELKIISSRFNEDITGNRTYPVEIDVSYSGRENNGSVIIEYVVTGVSWSGVYDLRGNSEDGSFTLVTQANIRQNTGENWNEAELTLSSARPAAGISPGVLQPWRLRAGNIGQASPARSAGVESKKEMAAEEEMDDIPVMPEFSDAAESAEVTVKIPTRESVASDNSEHRVMLSTSKLSAQMSYVAIPSLAGSVFIKARMKNTSPMPLVLGDMNLFLDGNFVGNTILSSHAAVGEEFDVFLGPDQRLQIKRRLLRGDIVGAGVFDKKVEVLNQWQIEISNYSGKARTVTVYDQFPVPADPNILTKFVETSRKETSRDLNGILKWTLDVAPGGTEKFDFSYSINLPENLWNNYLQIQENNRKALIKRKSQFQQMDEAPNAPMEQKQMYNLEQMFMK